MAVLGMALWMLALESDGRRRMLLTIAGAGCLGWQIGTWL